MNNDGDTALIYALKYKALFVAEYIIGQFPVDITIQNREGKTALDFAVMIRDDNLVDKMLKKDCTEKCVRQAQSHIAPSEKENENSPIAILLIAALTVFKIWY